jgi:hypothetical protein
MLPSVIGGPGGCLMFHCQGRRSFTHPQKRVCFQSARLQSFTLQLIEITVWRQFGWSEAKSGGPVHKRAPILMSTRFRSASCGLQTDSLIKQPAADMRHRYLRAQCCYVFCLGFCQRMFTDIPELALDGFAKSPFVPGTISISRPQWVSGQSTRSKDW